MKLGRRSDIPEAGFDLTPMIDVVLLLIIFFTLSSQFIQKDRQQISVPTEKGEATAAQNREPSVIDIERDGTLWINKRRVTRDELAVGIDEEVRAASGLPDRVVLVVRADREGPATHLNAVALLLASKGVRSWRLATSGGGS